MDEKWQKQNGRTFRYWLVMKSDRRRNVAFFGEWAGKRDYLPVKIIKYRKYIQELPARALT